MDSAAIARRAPAWLVRAVRRRPASLRWWEQRLWNGFEDTVVSHMRSRLAQPRLRVARRAQAHLVLARWAVVTGDDQTLESLPRWAQRQARRDAVTRATSMRALPGAQDHTSPTPTESLAAPTHVNVVMISCMSLQGGTTSSNIQEIEAQRRAGLTTGLIHHPVWDWDVTRPVSPRIADLVDNGSVRWLNSEQTVTCDVLIIRAPKLAEVIMDNLPRIDAKHTVVIVNQTPNYYYDAKGGHGEAYDLARCVDNVAATWGEAHWYPIGPRVREALVDHHADAMPAAALAAQDWLNIIDVAAWQRDAPREADGTIRLGRHSRDDAVKWPETRDQLLAAYPGEAPYEVRVLGGAQTVRELLGAVPKRWVVHEFNAVDVREFLHSLDVYVYFTASTYTEAFGRAPLEALAVGLPVIMPPVFGDLYGDAALYCEPHEVLSHVDRLMGSEQDYREHVERAKAIVAQRFGYRAHIDRLAALGAKA